MNAVWAIATVVIKELYRRKDFYVLFILTALITLLMGSMNFFGDDQLVRYLKEICLLLIWVSALVIAVTTAARQIPVERESRTIFPLLAKPVTRGQVVLGKFLGCWMATAFSLAVFYLFFGLVCGAREHAWPVAGYLQAFWLQWWMLAIVVSMALAGSLVFAAPSSNATICLVCTLALLLVGRHLNTVALTLKEPGQTILYGLYFAIPHLEFFDLRDFVIHNWPPIGWAVCAVATVYAGAYSALFLFVGWLLFRRKSLN